MRRVLSIARLLLLFGIACVEIVLMVQIVSTLWPVDHLLAVNAGLVSSMGGALIVFAWVIWTDALATWIERRVPTMQGR